MGTYRICRWAHIEFVATGRSAVVTACSWPFKVLVGIYCHIPTRMIYLQVVRTIWSSWSVRQSDVEDLGVESHSQERGFFMGHDRYVRFVLLLLNEASAPCLGGNHSVYLLTLRDAPSLNACSSGMV
jgi:hypothetical protein